MPRGRLGMCMYRVHQQHQLRRGSVPGAAAKTRRKGNRRKRMCCARPDRTAVRVRGPPARRPTSRRRRLAQALALYGVRSNRYDTSTLAPCRPFSTPYGVFLLFSLLGSRLPAGEHRITHLAFLAILLRLRGLYSVPAFSLAAVTGLAPPPQTAVRDSGLGPWLAPGSGSEAHVGLAVRKIAELMRAKTGRPLVPRPSGCPLPVLRRS